MCVVKRGARKREEGHRERKYSLALTHWGKLRTFGVVIVTQKVNPKSVGSRNNGTVFTAPTVMNVIRLARSPVIEGGLLVVAVEHPFAFSHQVVDSIPDIVYS